MSQSSLGRPISELTRPGGRLPGITEISRVEHAIVVRIEAA